MNYLQSREYIKSSEQYGSVLGLQNMQNLMARLGNPQDRLKIIHVAGTNGKGSVIAYLYSVLSKEGYRVGRYISPTLYSYRERMEIAGEKISREKFAEMITIIADAIEGMVKEGLPHPTTFEIETAAAFLYFAGEGCDLVLLEVGMGGNLDATNIIRKPVLSVLVSISMDHMSFLGNTLGEIAEKKAGIIKPGCPMAAAPQKPEARKSVEAACRRCGVPYVEADAEQAVTLEENVRGQTFSYQGETFQISLGGVYQKENAVLALKALEILQENGYPTSLQNRKQGLLQARWNGRFTTLCEKPLFIVDGAHNPAAAEQMEASIRHYFQGKKIYYIIGMFKDKDYRSVLKRTCPYAEKILIIETPDNPRALPAEELAEAAREFHTDVHACASIQEAVDDAFSMAEEQDVILAFGSLSFIGALSSIIEEREDNHVRFTGLQKTD
jgi:dihydrofolate synthase/folylpolyglutamate synthase